MIRNQYDNRKLKADPSITSPIEQIDYSLKFDVKPCPYLTAFSTITSAPLTAYM